MRTANASVSPPWRTPPLYVCTYMVTMSQQSWGKKYTGFWAVSAQARDEVHHWVWGLLNVLHLARPSRLCLGRSRPCSRRLPATSFISYVEIFNRLLVRKDTYQSRSMYTSNIVKGRVSRCACNLTVSGSNVGRRYFFVCQFPFIFCWRNVFVTRV